MCNNCVNVFQWSSVTQLQLSSCQTADVKVNDKTRHLPPSITTSGQRSITQVQIHWHDYDDELKYAFSSVHLRHQHDWAPSLESHFCFRTMNSSISWILRDMSRLQACVLSYESLLSFNKCGNETVVFFQLCSTSLTLQMRFCCLSGLTWLLMYFLFSLYFGSRDRKLHSCGYRILPYVHCI